MLKHIKTDQRSFYHAKSGFTMVELMLAMAFVAVLLITIAIVTTNIITIYQKGLTLKAVNSVGRGLIDEMTSSINTAPSVDTTSLCHSLVDGDANVSRCVKNHAFDYIFHASTNSNGEQLNGIFCTGYYSYVWNTYYGLRDKQTLTLRYRDKNNNNVEVKDTRLLKIKDSTYRVCSAVMNSDYTSQFTSNMTIDITTLAHSRPTDEHPLWNVIQDPPQEGMLNQFDLDLALYEFTVFPISQDSVTLRTYMSGTFILATFRGNVDIMRSGDYCSPGGTYVDADGNTVTDTSSLGNLGSKFNYCAINKFNFAARTAGV